MNTQPNIIVENIISNLKQPSDFHFYSLIITGAHGTYPVTIKTFSFRNKPTNSERRQRIGLYLQKKCYNLYDISQIWNNMRSSFYVDRLNSLIHNNQKLEFITNKLKNIGESKEGFYNSFTPEEFYLFISFNISFMTDRKIRIEKIDIDVE
jgi:hypothetical protein